MKRITLLESMGMIALLLPMAKGYAAKHPKVAVNQQLIEEAQTMIHDWREARAASRKQRK